MGREYIVDATEVVSLRMRLDEKHDHVTSPEMALAVAEEGLHEWKSESILVHDYTVSDAKTGKELLRKPSYYDVDYLLERIDEEVEVINTSDLKKEDIALRLNQLVSVWRKRINEDGRMSQSILVRCGDDRAPFYETPTWLTHELLSLTNEGERFKRYYAWLELEKKESYRSMAEHFLKLGDWFSKYANKTITWETT